jgi:MiaB/RimO family radical SAM methylthiotransferase
MKTFSITTLGCRVNHYESEQLAALLRQRGLVQTAPGEAADVRVVHTCSVTVQAASKSRQAVRRMTRLPVLCSLPVGEGGRGCEGVTDPRDPECAIAGESTASSAVVSDASSKPVEPLVAARRGRVIVTGCWATSDPLEAAALQGVDAVLGHHQDVNRELNRLLTGWEAEERASLSPPTSLDHGNARSNEHDGPGSPEPVFDDGWMTKQAGTPAGLITRHNEPQVGLDVNGKLEEDENPCEEGNEGEGRRMKAEGKMGMVTLPLLFERQGGHQRAFLKVQDGCDAHCTYCIIPQLRPVLWSKPVEEAVEEARRLVDCGHVEIVLTGIFLGAYGQGTALRRRQGVAKAQPLGELVEALCTRVAGLRRLRLSSLEPGDLTGELIQILRSHRQVVPHFHLPLQSGSDVLLRRMNRQYRRDDFLRMVDEVRGAFDRPAITTDVIVGFPGETAEEFARTLDVVERVGFIHIHAFSYSPRPGTAAARWKKGQVGGVVVNERIALLKEMAVKNSLGFRRRLLGEVVEVLVERSSEAEMEALAGYRHGRCERYFAVHFDAVGLEPGTAARVRIDRVTATRTFGSLVEVVG